MLYNKSVPFLPNNLPFQGQLMKFPRPLLMAMTTLNWAVKIYAFSVYVNTNMHYTHATINNMMRLHVFYNKASSWPSTKSFLSFGNILVLDVS